MMTKMLGVALAAIALGAVTVAPAGAAPEGNTIVEITNVANGLCLDSVAPIEHRMSMSACAGSAAQRFERIPASTGGGSYLRGIDGHCVGGTYLLVEQQCARTEAGQRFQELPDVDGTVRLATTTDAGTRFADTYFYEGYREVIMATDDSPGPTRLWVVREVGVMPPPQLGSVVKLRSASKGTCVAEGQGEFNLSKPCDIAPGFDRLDTGDGRVALRSQESGRCLQLLQFPETLVHLRPCDLASDGQLWKLTGDELDNYTVVNGEQYLTPFNGRVIATENFSQHVLQHWQLLPA
ncbi:RICIN domain-containing protein [Lentzea fradiae]|nr:RICIN domain-containing protein [Lentzea fradiae]